MLSAAAAAACAGVTVVAALSSLLEDEHDTAVTASININDLAQSAIFFISYYGIVFLFSFPCRSVTRRAGDSFATQRLIVVYMARRELCALYKEHFNPQKEYT
jgi:hypothetical protein